MAASRLNDTQKQELVARYRAGEASSVLAEAFGCSVNTVSRTVRTLLPAEEYDALKAARAKGKGLATPVEAPQVSEPEMVAGASDQPAASSSSRAAETAEEIAEENVAAISEAVDTDAEDLEDGRILALDDADDFGSEDEDEESSDDDSSDEAVGFDGQVDFANQFHEVAILTGVTHVDSHEPVACQPIGPGVLPDSVYMLVDKVVELDPRPLSDFPELGTLDSSDQERQALCLYASPRSAKRQCGRNQRVIRVPDTNVFTLTTSYLLARGITRLVLEGSLIALDS
jgi:hypothetical protein